MVQAAGHHRAITQHPKLVPQPIAKGISLPLPGGKIRPFKALAKFQIGSLCYFIALPYRGPLSGESPVQLLQHEGIQVVLPRERAIQIPKAQPC